MPMHHRTLKQALLAMDDEGEEEEQQLRGNQTAADTAAAGSGGRRRQTLADRSDAVNSQSRRPVAVTSLQLTASLSIPHADCTDGDDELSESSTAAVAASSAEGAMGSCGGASAAHQQQLTSKISSQTEHQLFVDDMRSDGSNDDRGADDSAARRLTRRSRSASRSRIRRRHRSRSRSTRRRVFANATFPACSPDSDASDSSDESQSSASMRVLRGRSQLCGLLVGGRCRSQRGLLIRTVMRPGEIKDLLDGMLMDGTIIQRSVADESGRTLSVYGLKDEDAAAAPTPQTLGAAAATAIPAEWTPAASDDDGSF